MKKNKELINRTEALKKLGKYSALTAATTFMLLSPKAAANDSVGTGNGGLRNGPSIWKD